MTKPLPVSTLHRVLNDGAWTLVFDPTFTSAKKVKAAMKQRSSQDFRGVSISELESPQPFEPSLTSTVASRPEP